MQTSGNLFPSFSMWHHVAAAATGLGWAPREAKWWKIPLAPFFWAIFKALCFDIVIEKICMPVKPPSCHGRKALGSLVEASTIKVIYQSLIYKLWVVCELCHAMPDIIHGVVVTWLTAPYIKDIGWWWSHQSSCYLTHFLFVKAFNAYLGYKAFK